MSRVAESWRGEPRDLSEWLALEEERVLALLGREVVRLHGHLDTRAHHLMAVVDAIRFVHDAPIDPRDTLRTLATALRDNVSSARLPADAHRDAQVFLLHVERLLDWVANG